MTGIVYWLMQGYKPRLLRKRQYDTSVVPTILCVINRYPYGMGNHFGLSLHSNRLASHESTLYWETPYIYMDVLEGYFLRVSLIVNLAEFCVLDFRVYD